MNVLACLYCKYRHKSVILFRNSNVSYNVLYLDIICEYTDDPSEFIGWEDFKDNNNVMYDKLFLLNFLISRNKTLT